MLSHGAQGSRGLPRRLGAYLLGIAIGFVFLGLFRAQHTRMRQQQLQQARDESVAGDPASPPADEASDPRHAPDDRRDD